MAAPPIDQRHKHHFHRGSPIREPVRVATTGNITISTALNSGDTIDGVTLAAGDRVLVWQQSTDTQNGIYDVGPSPSRSYDASEDTGDDIIGTLIIVLEGTTYGGHVFRNADTTQPAYGTDPVTFEEISGAGSSPEAPVEHGSMGATETFDLADGHWHRGTLTADLTTTVQGFTVDLADIVYVAMVQDGTGGWAVTHDASVVFASDDQPGQNPGDVTWFAFWSLDGDSTVYGAIVGGSSVTTGTPALTFGTSNATGAASTVIATDASIAIFDATVPVTQAFGDTAATGSAAFAARRDHVHGMPADPGSGSGGHAHVAGETHLSDGSTGLYTLDQSFEPGSVIAWNITTIARLTVTETAPDQATVSPVGSSGDSIVFDYAATLA